VGYDDIDYAESAAVPLSTVRQPTELLAHHAVRLVLDEANDPEHLHEHLKLPPELIVRKSSAAS
jgi:LacI family transcriptional regulator